MKKLFLLLGIPLLFCCNEPNRSHNEFNRWQTVAGRDDGTDAPRPLIYRVKVNPEWERRTPLAQESILDSTKPLAEFYIHDDGQAIRITIHNFPTDSFEHRIPPTAQIARWQQQIESLNPVSLNIQPIAYGGFGGLYFEAEGHEIKVMGWGMQLCAEHYRNLFSYDPTKQNIYRQLRADYTIKATGPIALMEKHKQEILSFANSFEMIEEIPTRL